MWEGKIVEKNSWMQLHAYILQNCEMLKNRTFVAILELKIIDALIKKIEKL